MKRRIYKKWLKNPLNRRLIWKFCKPFPKIPVATIGEPSVKTLAEAIEIIERRIYEETMIPKERIVYEKASSTSFAVSDIWKKNLEYCIKNQRI